VRGAISDGRPYRVGDSNLPRRTGSDLLTSDESVGQPAVNGGSIQAEDACGFANGSHFSFGWFG
jgi:hypothetical protein